MNSFRYRRSEKVAVSLLFLVLSVLCGCASAPHPDRYRLQGIQQQLVVRYGVVIAVRPVEVEAPGTGVGSTIGASAAATAASGLSPPRVAIGSSIAAGALGQWIGQEAERRLGRAKAVEIHYRDENTNEEFVLVQAESAKAPIRPGDRIRVVIGPESVRATRIDPATTR